MLFIGNDWAEGHHDVVIQDEAGRTLARRRLPEGVDGLARLHELIASCWGEDSEPDPVQVVIVIETERGPWVKALAASGYRVYAVNPKQAARHKETVAVSGKKDDFFDAACRARRRGDLAQRARDIQAALRTPHLAQPAIITEAYAASVQAGAAVIIALNEQVKIMEAKVSELFRRHPDAGIYLPATPATATRCAASPTASPGILHGCVKTGSRYDEDVAWSHRAGLPQAA